MAAGLQVTAIAGRLWAPHAGGQVPWLDSNAGHTGTGVTQTGLTAR
jgi:hypothetical protein